MLWCVVKVKCIYVLLNQDLVMKKQIFMKMDEEICVFQYFILDLIKKLMLLKVVELLRVVKEMIDVVEEFCLIGEIDCRCLF